VDPLVLHLFRVGAGEAKRSKVVSFGKCRVVVVMHFKTGNWSLLARERAALLAATVPASKFKERLHCVLERVIPGWTRSL
jgi:hypothetical protein